MKVIASNPCAEQPLTAYAVCNLASLNLSQFVDRTNKKILDQELITAVQTCVRMQDNVIDLSEPFLEQVKKQKFGERRMGLGVMGLSDLLI